MKILHTSDWHIGCTLHDQKRYDEFNQFFAWLKDTIENEKADALIVAGDIFDTPTPNNSAQTLYYNFLKELSKSSYCHNVVVIAGNHDSPSLLDAPKELLKILNVHVVGTMPDNKEDEVIVLEDNNGKAEAIICAVPFLRERDIRMTGAGQSRLEQEQAMKDGVKAHYEEIAKIAEEKRNLLGENLPCIALGHLYAMGGQVAQEDSETLEDVTCQKESGSTKNTFIGNLGGVGIDTFSDTFDYVALGHLHIPQIVGNRETCRYSGSPIAIDFNEANQRKILCSVEFTDRKPKIDTIHIPKFQKLKKICGSLEEITKAIKKLKKEDESVWLNIVCTENEGATTLKDTILKETSDSKILPLNFKSLGISRQIFEHTHSVPKLSLKDMDHKDIFNMVLEKQNNLSPEEKEQMLQLYDEVLLAMQEDVNAG